MSEMEYVREHEVIVNRDDLLMATASLEATIDRLLGSGLNVEHDRQALQRLRASLGLKENDND